MFNAKSKLALINAVEAGVGPFLSNATLQTLREDGLIVANPVMSGKRGRPAYTYHATPKANSLRNLSKSWK